MFDAEGAEVRDQVHENDVGDIELVFDHGSVHDSEVGDADDGICDVHGSE